MSSRSRLWRHLTNATIDGQSICIARIQIQHPFAATYPVSENITVEWVTEFATANIKDFEDFGFKRVWNPLKA